MKGQNVLLAGIVVVVVLLVVYFFFFFPNPGVTIEPSQLVQNDTPQSQSDVMLLECNEDVVDGMSVWCYSTEEERNCFGTGASCDAALVMELDASGCDNAEDREECYFDLAMMQQDVDVCGLLESAEDEQDCVEAIAIDLRNPGLCSQADDVDGCYRGYAVSNVDEDACSLISDESGRADCVSGIESTL